MSDGINPATPSFSSSPLLQFPNVPHQLPTMPYFRSQHSTLPSQQDRAQGLLGNEYGFRPCLSQGSVSSVTSSSPLVPASSHVPSSKHVSPPKLVPIFKKRHPSRQASSALLRLRKQEMLTGTSEETGSVTLPSFRNTTLAITSSSPYSSHLTNDVLSSPQALQCTTWPLTSLGSSCTKVQMWPQNHTETKFWARSEGKHIWTSDFWQQHTGESTLEQHLPIHSHNSGTLTSKYTWNKISYNRGKTAIWITVNLAQLNSPPQILVDPISCPALGLLVSPACPMHRRSGPCWTTWPLWVHGGRELFI